MYQSLDVFIPDEIIDGKLVFTKEHFKEAIQQAFNDGYDAGFDAPGRINPYTPQVTYDQYTINPCADNSKYEKIPYWQRPDYQSSGPTCYTTGTPIPNDLMHVTCYSDKSSTSCDASKAEIDHSELDEWTYSQGEVYNGEKRC